MEVRHHVGHRACGMAAARRVVSVSPHDVIEAALGGAPDRFEVALGSGLVGDRTGGAGT